MTPTAPLIRMKFNTMHKYTAVNRETGAITIFVCMMMLLLITALVLTAYSLSTLNLRAVGNVQARDGAIAAANFVIEETVGSDFWLRDDPETVPVDINEDGAPDYSVVLSVPECVRATPAARTTSSSVTLPGFSSISSWNTIWELQAVATDSVTGAEVTVVQGIRVLLSTAFKNSECAT